MAKAKVAKIPVWAVGHMLTLAVILLFFLYFDFLDAVDARLSDLRMKLLGSHRVDGRIAIVASDDGFLSPEQIGGHKVDGRSDLLSLGVLPFELLAGEQLFRADSIAAVMFQITSAEPRALAPVAPGVPAGVQAAVAKALRKPVAERFQTGAAFAAEVRAGAARAPVAAG